MKDAEEYMEKLQKQIDEQEQKADEDASSESGKLVEQAMEEADPKEEGNAAQEAEEDASEQEDEAAAEDEEEGEEQEEGAADDDEADEVDDESEEAPRSNKTWADMRNKLKERDEELAKLREAVQQVQLQQAEQKGRIEAQQAQAPAVDDDPEPDPVLDPDEHNTWLLRQRDKEISELRATQEQHSAQFQVQQARQAINVLESEYKRQNPNIDYGAMKDFVKQREAALLKIRYPQASDLQINSALEQAEFEVFAGAHSNQANGAAIIVDMARQHGYEPINGKEETKKKVDYAAVKKNKKKSASLIGGSDGTRQHEVSPNQVLNMGFDDLLKNEGMIDKALKSAQRFS